MRFEISTDVETPAAALWAAVADVEDWPNWTASMREVAWLDGAGLALGARARVKQPALPTAVWTVSELEAGRVFTWRNAAPGLTSIGRHLVEPLGGARSRLTLVLSQTGALAPLTSFIAGARSRRYVQMELAGLKRAAESRTAGAG